MGPRGPRAPGLHAKALPAARVELFDSQGHSPHLEAANRFNYLLAAFLGSALA